MWTSNFYRGWDYWLLYHKVTFDGDNRLILINYGETDITVTTQIYSDWKEWWQVRDNAKYPQALSVIGGESIGSGLTVGATYFLENGWRIKPWEGNHNITLTGNIYTREEGESIWADVEGQWKINAQNRVSALVFQTTGTTTGSAASVNADEIADAVWKYATTGSTTSGEMGHHVTTQLLTFAQYLAAK